MINNCRHAFWESDVKRKSSSASKKKQLFGAFFGGFWKLPVPSLLFYCQSVLGGILKILQSKGTERLLQSIYRIDTLPRQADRMSSLHVVFQSDNNRTVFFLFLEQTKSNNIFICSWGGWKIFMLVMRRQRKGGEAKNGWRWRLAVLARRGCNPR